MFRIAKEVTAKVSKGQEMAVARKLMAQGLVPIRGVKSWNLLGCVRLHDAQRVCKALGWGAGEWVSHARSLFPPRRDGKVLPSPWPWRVREVRALVTDLAPHDGAGFLIKRDLFLTAPVQFRAVGKKMFAKGVLLTKEHAPGAGIHGDVDVVLSQDHFKGEHKPAIGEIVTLEVLARPMFPGLQWASWETILMLESALSPEEREEFLKDLFRSIDAFLEERLHALQAALEGDLEPLFEALGDPTWGLKEALAVFGLCKETSSLLRTAFVRQIADGLRSAGLRGKRLLLVVSEKGATPDRDGDAVVVRMPVRRPQGVLTVKLTPSARSYMRRGVMLLHPTAATLLDGDDDGDNVAVFTEPWLVEWSRRLSRLDPAFEQIEKGEKVRRSFGTELRDFWNAAWLSRSEIGQATLQLYAALMKGNIEAAAAWSQRMQDEVDRLKWEVDLTPAPVRPIQGLFPWRKTPKRLEGFAPADRDDAVSRVWNHAIPRLAELAQAFVGLQEMTPIDLVAHLRPEAEPTKEDLVAAQEIWAEWKASWRILAQLYGGVENVPEDEGQALRRAFCEKGRSLPLKVLGGIVSVNTRFPFKNIVIDTRWGEVCKPRPDAVRGKAACRAGHVSMYDAPPNIPGSFQVSLRKVDRGVEVLALAKGRTHSLGFGLVVGRLPRRFKGQFTVKDGELVIVPL